MTDEPRGRAERAEPRAAEGAEKTEEEAPRRVRVVDKRGGSRPLSPEPNHAPGVHAVEELTVTDATSEESEPERDYLEDLQRLQAEFDNARKRMMREQTELTRRASARLIEKLLPVLDNFERALAHGQDSAGLALVHKDLVGLLAAEGLEEIPATGRPFDPQVHEAVESHEDPGVTEPVVTGVYRAGYKLAGRVLRPAMVVVARPPDPGDDGPDDDVDEGASGDES
jgi:molecular chaperone GrpE